MQLSAEEAARRLASFRRRRGAGPRMQPAPSDGNLRCVINCCAVRVSASGRLEAVEGNMEQGAAASDRSNEGRNVDWDESFSSILDDPDVDEWGHPISFLDDVLVDMRGEDLVDFTPFLSQSNPSSSVSQQAGSSLPPSSAGQLPSRWTAGVDENSYRAATPPLPPFLVPEQVRQRWAVAC